MNYFLEIIKNNNLLSLGLAGLLFSLVFWRFTAGALIIPSLIAIILAVPISRKIKIFLSLVLFGLLIFFLTYYYLVWL
ncbi:hypothetical protein A3H65_02090 [Candidatus Giovannonibacteria bacterium RIFCSPLOWO2_02_FULL_45_14]|uniref:Uncharacterized protein n=1 Tax=Candidatus Giovannonibacteria bacterium RIFCSPLOWO2_12_FULL_44_15 TaxID=1798364 RepID=A0A1F5Y0F3_9BACT|nr:MAG: hypothetical protein A3C75_03935 [Candidatus Giovannonibacteria bacterium RIFCSPHIGHO2_02_FULL_44_31]OGF77112.1 MAG: hypothetical protein A3E62_03650 [Candidatus Giovannonibacteria bacterium RIFCSPHIGHO2_12_FULL_44_29]OGF91353.1 MAG: hypothetical protein A3H65_02090 [Candidatus Giovannonibacteria bacterium RIFCSPLOWO2_02_FULL_45_14]OGF93341.1 MAG: hypothetical protein A3G54_00370 [Candidatus Giovannonibacteria bacterium RIFCSPLOWO2_12_FULL_44_15]